ncbi:hypothetical protein [uncultured Marinobacter sp.]|uniref:hypothetical protein n=1 Tax=uncultured Marinobacter sp. TaxID=187379 RepID=UPI0030D88291
MTSSLIRSILVLCLAVPAMALSGDQQTTAQAAEPTRQDYLQQIHALQTSFRERAPSADERQRFYALVEAMQTSGDDQLRDNILDTSEDHETGISLPVYPGSKLLMHARTGIDLEFNERPLLSLPTASFLTRAAPQEVLAFYQTALPGYQLRQGDDDNHFQLLQQLPDQPGLDVPESYLLANVRIRPTDSRTGVHLEGARTLYHLYYPLPD